MELSQIRLIEELAANAWRPEVEQHLGGWRARYSGGNSRRVNSVWPNAPLGAASLQEGVEWAEAFYDRRGVSPCFQLCPAAQPAELHQVLSERGYRFYAHTQVQVQSIATLLGITAPSVERAIAADTLTDTWFELYTSASGYSAESLPVRRGILSRIGPAAHFVSLHHAGQLSAVGLGVVERGWLGVFCVVTSPISRQQGLATGVMHALAEWGRQQNAEQIYLQVMEDNQPALSLYSKLGFTRLYQYYYAVKDGKDEKAHGDRPVYRKVGRDG
ncbi:MAG TPA: GNAT family N-acetyltransferase [Anaerolineales bacterium]|jgi:ribosomal protein S18 acetylase RimI-like enzyme|nr:GNAT family N-acetyltransferase [Anaerolineales bacterium]